MIDRWRCLLLHWKPRKWDSAGHYCQVCNRRW